MAAVRCPSEMKSLARRVEAKSITGNERLQMISSEFNMSVGTEWLVDAEGCSAELLGDVEAVRHVCEQVIHDLDLRIVGEGCWHKFPPPGGVTGLFLLTESHLACHTYPELGVATFNLYCCKHRPDWPWEKQLARALGASVVTVRIARRGANTAPSSDPAEVEILKRASSAEGVRRQ